MNLPGLASTRGVKLQKYRKFEDVGLILCSSTRLEDVPCADSFSVEDTLVVSASFVVCFGILFHSFFELCFVDGWLWSPFAFDFIFFLLSATTAWLLFFFYRTALFVFLVLSPLQVRKVDETHISVDISFCVLFLKSTMMKYIIERSTNGEMAKWLEVFFKHLKKVN